ncbi:MAG: hypothetical protein Q4G71_03900 [Pseudomonadota bacterium]|nr:hypothetical protein [Pseudomonadota bacterium]
MLYVVTGQTDPAAPRLSADEQELLDLFRAAPLLIKAAAIRALQHEGGQGSGMGGMQFTQHGSGMQVGHVSAPVTVGAPAPRRRKAG